MKRIDTTALRCAEIQLKLRTETALWEAFYDEWATAFEENLVSTADVLDAINMHKITSIPKEIHKAIYRKGSPAKALGITLRKYDGMMSQNGLVLIREYDTYHNQVAWRMVRVDPSTQL